MAPSHLTKEEWIQRYGGQAKLDADRFDLEASEVYRVEGERMKIPEGLKCEVTPEIIYPNGVPEIPDGFEFVRFGKAAPGDIWLTEDGIVAEAHPKHYTGWPLIIVRKKPQSPPRQWVVEFDGDGAFRVIREVKPITRQRIREFTSGYCGPMVRQVGGSVGLMNAGTFLISVLRELGVEVQD